MFAYISDERLLIAPVSHGMVALILGAFVTNAFGGIILEVYEVEVIL